MTETAATPDPTMEAIGNAVALGRQGEQESARHDLLAIWQQMGPVGDPLHRCTLAHYMADLYQEPAEALIWDIRALDAADSLTDDRAQQHHASLQVAGFYPSLYLNIADNLRRLSAFNVAAKYIQNAKQHSSALPEGPYGATIIEAIDEVHKVIDNRDTVRRESDPGAVG